jgi:hypothetical protein
MKTGYLHYASTDYLADLPKNTVDKKSIMLFVLHRLKHNLFRFNTKLVAETKAADYSLHATCL